MGGWFHCPTISPFFGLLNPFLFGRICLVMTRHKGVAGGVLMKNKMRSNCLAKILLKFVAAFVALSLSTTAWSQPSDEEALLRILRASPQEGYVSCFLFLKASRLVGDPMFENGIAEPPLGDFILHSPANCLVFQTFALKAALPFKKQKGLGFCLPDSGDWKIESAKNYLRYFEKNLPLIEHEKMTGASVMTLAMQELYFCK